MENHPDVEMLSATGTEFTTPTRYDPKVKARAYHLYLNTDLAPDDIAIDVAVPKSVVLSWARDGKWRDRKLELEREVLARAEDSYRQLIIANRKPVLERHLRVGAKLEEAIEKVLDEATRDDGLPSDMKLKRLAEALASATGITARAAAISDKPFGETMSGGGDKPKKTPLVVIGVTAQVSPDNAPPPITVTVKDEDEA